MLDTGGYGILVINKSISIVAVGVEASIAMPANGTGISIKAGFGDAVSLHGLTLDGAGVGETGIEFDSGLSLTIVDCVVRNMRNDGLAGDPHRFHPCA